MTGPSHVGVGERFESLPSMLVLGCKGLAATIGSAFPGGDTENRDDSHLGVFELTLLGILSIDERLTALAGSPDPIDGSERRLTREDLLR